MKKVFIIWLFSICVCEAAFSQTPTQIHIDTLRKKISRITTIIKSENIDQSTIDEAIYELNAVKDLLGDFRVHNDTEVSNVRSELQSSVIQLEQKLATAQSELTDLQTQVNALRASNTNETLRVVEGIIAEKNKQDEVVKNLTAQNNELNNYNKKIEEEKNSLSLSLGEFKEKSSELSTDLEESRKKLDTYSSSIKVGLSIGFDYFLESEPDYIVQEDSTVKRFNGGSGASGMISSVVSIKLGKSNKGRLVINIPLTDFTNRENSVGIFNQRTAVGLGYSYSPFLDTAPNLSLGLIFNISSYKQIDDETFIDNSRKVNLPEFTRLDAENFGATNKTAVSFTFGIIYSFINAGGKSSD